MERQTVSIMKACEMVGVSRRTIYNWIAAGKVEYVRTAGGSIRIFTDTLWRQPDGTVRTLSPSAVADAAAGAVASTTPRPSSRSGRRSSPSHARRHQVARTVTRRSAADQSRRSRIRDRRVEIRDRLVKILTVRAA